MQLGKEMGLEGAKLLAFVENQQKLEEERRREEDKRRKEAEEREEERRREQEDREEKRRQLEEERRKEDEEKEERRRREDEEREARRQQRELRKLEMEAELNRKRPWRLLRENMSWSLHVYDRSITPSIAYLIERIGPRLLNYPHLLTAGMIWTHIFNALRDLQPTPSGKRPVGLPS